ncbi:MAG: chromosome segregation protein SMC, partial [Thermostichales cyanobacterium DRC_bins_46]
CSLSELHEQLEALHIYPQGYNVVLQGDVTQIISMNSKERRQIIDELAGVAHFDRKIEQSRQKLEAVKEQIERYKLIEQEWQEQSQKLEQDSQKAKQYQALREQKQQLEQERAILLWQHLQEQQQQFCREINRLQQEQAALQGQIEAEQTCLSQAEQDLQELQRQIHVLGESDYLDLKSRWVVAQGQQQQAQATIQQAHSQMQACQQHLLESQEQLAQLEQQQQLLAAEEQHQHSHHQTLSTNLARQQLVLEERRARLQVLAQSADTWIQQHQYFSGQIQELLQELEPQQQEQIRLQTQVQQLQEHLQTLSSQAQHLQAEQQTLAEQQHSLTAQLQTTIAAIQERATRLSHVQEELALQQTTAKRLQNELFQLQRHLDKLENRQQLAQEQQGSRAAQLILQGGLMGVWGLVAQLGQVDPQYRLALEVAAGNRLNFVVVEDTITAELGIELLKRERAGRLTFLPLDKMQAARPLPPLNLPGMVDYALRLVNYEARFRDIFAFVFGQTVVFRDLPAARPYIGKHRMVTLEGDLLELSGAMTGGTVPAGQTHFQADLSGEIREVQSRIQDLETMLAQLAQTLRHLQAQEEQLRSELTQARQEQQRQQTQLEHCTSTLDNLQQQQHNLTTQQQQSQNRYQLAQQRLGSLTEQIPLLEERLRDLHTKLRQVEQSSLNPYWHQAQQGVQEQEQVVAASQEQLRQLEQHLQRLRSEQQLLAQRRQHLQQRHQEWQQQHQQHQQQLALAQAQQQQAHQLLEELGVQLQGAEARLGLLQQARDAQELKVKQAQQALQRWQWQLYQAQQQQQEYQARLAQLEPQLQEAAAQLPPAPPRSNRSLEEVSRQQRRLEEKLRALEPVNMLAIEEYESLQGKLQDLHHKLTTLNQERTELLLRIENFATLRQQTFMEAFQAVDQHFRTIFAQLSDGDGYLSLENPEDPLSGGLTLVAHPKGKPVRHLAAMSGGEKSLTALSFIFALQRYRPSGFYAFDEVDMFLDGANVEKLAAMIQQQSQQAQFLVVSLRRPMIEKADRTLGVTQARGATTQVIGMTLR